MNKFLSEEEVKRYKIGRHTLQRQSKHSLTKLSAEVETLPHI